MLAGSGVLSCLAKVHRGQPTESGTRDPVYPQALVAPRRKPAPFQSDPIQQRKHARPKTPVGRRLRGQRHGLPHEPARAGLVLAGTRHRGRAGGEQPV